MNSSYSWSGILGIFGLLTFGLLHSPDVVACEGIASEPGAVQEWSEAWVEGHPQGWLTARLSPSANAPDHRGQTGQAKNIKDPHGWETLNAHGTWKHTRRWGRVWVPDTHGREWRPYLHGRWLWSEGGWHFAGDEAFADLVYHHGRWYNHRTYGWSWIPGSVWAPSWVVWRFGGGYVGWAPLGPSEDNLFPEGKLFNSWVFVPVDRFFARRLRRVAVSTRENRQVLDRTGFVDGRTRRTRSQYHPGPSPRRLRRFVGAIPVVRTTASPARRIQKPKVKTGHIQLIPQLRSRRLTLRHPAFPIAMKRAVPVHRVHRVPLHRNSDVRGVKTRKSEKTKKPARHGKKKLHRFKKRVSGATNGTR